MMIDYPESKWLAYIAEQLMKEHKSNTKYLFVTPRRSAERIINNLKFIVSGGYIISENDGERYYIHPNTVRELYGVPRNKCKFTDSPYHHYSDEIMLVPQNDGDYDLIKRIMDHLYD